MMKNLTPVIASSIIVTLGVSAAVYILSGATDRPAREFAEVDPIVASFERELNHQRAPAARATGAAIDDDVLYEKMNKIHWSADPVDTDEAEETVDESLSKK